jgi:hypothetical protein
MSGFELDESGADEIDARAAAGGVPFLPAGPSFFEGTTGAAVKGLARGSVAKGALLLGDAVTPVLKPSAKAADKLLGTRLDAWLDEQQRRNRSAMDDLKPDPHTTGFAAQVVGGFLDIGSSAALFTPEGAAVLEGYARKQELEGQGVSPEAAAAGGAVSGVATLVGVKAPMTLGRAAVGQGAASVAKNMGFGAAVNISAGVAERGTLRELLERSGFPDQARMFDPYDQQAMLAEGALGALFSGGAAALELRNTHRGQQTIDAALAGRSANHRAVDTAPGVPADARAAAAHALALDTATAQTLRGERVNVGEALADTAFVPRDRQDASVQAELQAHVADLLPTSTTYTALTPNAPRGLRNNNPGNIEAGADRWEGQTGSDGRFATFQTPEAGIRALARTLLTYQDKHGLNTVEGIIGRWAPPSDNKTKAYVQAVADAIGFEPTTPLNLKDPKVLQSLTRAIIMRENGRHPYAEGVIRSGVDAALSGRSLVARGAEVTRPTQLTAEPDLIVRPGADALNGDVPKLAEGSSAPSAEANGARTVAEMDKGVLMRPLQDGGLGMSETVPVLLRQPRVKDLEPLAVGPVLVEPREIAPGRQLYRETSVDGLSELLADDNRPHVRQLYVADRPELAIGQGTNKGVQVVFREGALSGAEHRKPGTGEATGREYRTDMLAPRAIESFTVPTGFKPLSLRGVAKRALDEFEPTPQPDGSVVFARKPAASKTVSQSSAPADGRTEPVWANNERANPAAPVHNADAAVSAAQGRDPAMAAAAEVIAMRPDMLVALEDGTEIPAVELLARAEAERAQAEQDARAFQAAANCFLRS